MAQNWGAFAGGLGKGYMSADEMYQSRQRTQAIVDEAQIRKDSEARQKEQFKWAEEQRQRQQDYQNTMKTGFDNLPWVKDQNGQINPMDPANAENNNKLYGLEFQTRARLGMLQPADQKAYLDAQKQTKDTKIQEAGRQFISTMDPTYLEAVDPKYKGAKVVQDKLDGHPSTSIQLTDGSKIPMAHIYAVTGEAGKTAATISNMESDNARQERVAQAQIKHMGAEDARSAALTAKAADSLKVETLLKVNNAIESKVLRPMPKPVVPGTEPDPVETAKVSRYNSTASAMIAERTKGFDKTKAGAMERVDAVNKIASEVNSELGRLESGINSDLADAKSKGKPVTPDKAMEYRQAAYDAFEANGYKIPSKYKPITVKK